MPDTQLSPTPALNGEMMSEQPITLPDAVATVEAHPDDARAWVTLGQQLMKQGRVTEARESFQRALRLEPELESEYEELRTLNDPHAMPGWFRPLKQNHRSTLRTNSLMVRLGVGIVVLLMLASVGVAIGWRQGATPARGLPSISVPPLLLDTETGRDAGRVRDDAAPLGAPILTDEGLRFSVQAVNPDAWPVVRASSETNTAPPPGYSMLLVRLLVENVLGDPDHGLLLVGSDFKALGESGATYDGSCGSIPESLSRLGNSLPRGRATEGNLCFLVSGSDSIEFLMYEPLFGGDDRRYFRLSE